MSLYSRIDSISSDPSNMSAWADENYFSKVAYILPDEAIPKFVFAGLAALTGGAEPASNMTVQYMNALNKHIQAAGQDVIVESRITGDAVKLQPHKLLYAWDADTDTTSENDRPTAIYAYWKASLKSPNAQTRMVASSLGLFVTMVLVQDRLKAANNVSSKVFADDVVAGASYNSLLYFVRHVMSDKPDALGFGTMAQTIIDEAAKTSLTVPNSLLAATRQLLRELGRYENSYVGGKRPPTATTPAQNTSTSASVLPLPPGPPVVAASGLPTPPGTPGQSVLQPPGPPSGSRPQYPAVPPAPVPSPTSTVPPVPVATTSFPGGPVSSPVPAPRGEPAVETRSPMSQSSSQPAETYDRLMTDVIRVTPLINKLARILGIPARDVYDFLQVLDELQESYQSGLLEVVDRMKERR